MKRKLENSELQRLDVAAFKKAEKAPMILVLDDVRSLHNIGSVFRTADAFRIQKLFLCGITATPPHRDIRKTALGATESVAWEYRQNTLALVEELKAQGIQTVAVEQAEGSVPLHAFTADSAKTVALIFGHEIKGVSQEVVSACDGVVEIPQFGTKHSLNIAVSVGVVVWDLWCKRNAQK